MKGGWLALVLVPAIGAAVFMAVRGFSEIGELQGIANDFGHEIRDGRYETAYARTSSGYRSMTSLEQFRTIVAGSTYLRGVTSISINELATEGGAARARGTMHSTAGDVSTEVDFTEERDVYLVAGITHRGRAGARGTPIVGR